MPYLLGEILQQKTETPWEKTWQQTKAPGTDWGNTELTQTPTISAALPDLHDVHANAWTPMFLPCDPTAYGVTEGYPWQQPGQAGG